MSIIPDSISPEDLAKLHGAKQEQEEIAEYARDRVNRLCDLAQDSIDLSRYEELDGDDQAMIHKIMLIDIAKHFLMFHNLAGNKLAGEGEHRCAGAWFRDAGKFQAILNLLDTIEITNSDFTIPHEGNE